MFCLFLLNVFFLPQSSNGVLTDFLSFYTLPSTVMHHPVHKSLKAAYSFYNVHTETPLLDLMNDALIIAKMVSSSFLYILGCFLGWRKTELSILHSSIFIVFFSPTSVKTGDKIVLFALLGFWYSSVIDPEENRAASAGYKLPSSYLSPKGVSNSYKPKAYSCVFDCVFPPCGSSKIS